MKDISLTDYIQVRHAVYLPHTAGRYAKKQFKKAQMPIVERLVDRWAAFGIQIGTLEICSCLNSLMMKGRNNGKKLLAVRIVAHAFEIIHLLTDQNPIQVSLLYDSIPNFLKHIFLSVITGSRRRYCQHWSSGGLHAYRLAGYRPSPGC